MVADNSVRLNIIRSNPTDTIDTEERGEEPGKETGKETSAAGAKLARLEPVEHQPSLL